jgi:hypothetical protein
MEFVFGMEYFWSNNFREEVKNEAQNIRTNNLYRLITFIYIYIHLHGDGDRWSTSIINYTAHSPTLL